MALNVSPSQEKVQASLALTGYGWHPEMCWLIMFPRAVREPHLVGVSRTEYSPCGMMELLLAPHTHDYIGLKYILAAELFGRDGIPVEAPRIVTIQQHVEDYHKATLGRTMLLLSTRETIANRHRAARVFLRGVFETIPPEVWAQVRATLSPDPS